MNERNFPNPVHERVDPPEGEAVRTLEEIDAIAALPLALIAHALRARRRLRPLRPRAA